MTALSKLLPLLAPDEDLSLALDHLAQVHQITTGASGLFRRGSEGLNLQAHAYVGLLFAPLLPPHSRLPPATRDRLVSVVSDYLSAPCTNGTYLLEHSRARKGRQPERYSTTLEDLDALLDGGFCAGEIIELCGPRRSGRTVLALFVVLLHLLLHADKRAAWLDTSGSFDPYRCLAILRDVLIPRLYALGGSFAGEDGQEPAAEDLAISVLDRLAVSRVSRSGDALDILSAEAATCEKSEVLSMVVVDTLDTFVGGDALANGSAKGHANLIAFMRRLSTLARSSNSPLTVLVITSAVPNPNSAQASYAPPAAAPVQPPLLSSLPLLAPLEPLLGPTLTYFTDLSLLLVPAEPLFGPNDGKDRTVLEVTRNTRGEKGGTVVFRLERGVLLEQLP